MIEITNSLNIIFLLVMTAVGIGETTENQKVAFRAYLFLAMVWVVPVHFANWFFILYAVVTSGFIAIYLKEGISTLRTHTDGFVIISVIITGGLIGVSLASIILLFV